MSSTGLDSGGTALRRGRFGYRRREVDAYVDLVERRISAQESELLAAQQELSDLRSQVRAPEELGRHLGAVLMKFAEAVRASEAEAAEEAERIIEEARRRAEAIESEARTALANARTLAAATFAEAERRYERITASRSVATARIEDAIESMADMLASLHGIPDWGEPMSAPSAEPPQEAAAHSDDGEIRGGSAAERLSL